jgi:type IV fimbrial biogenesis protein FimT
MYSLTEKKRLRKCDRLSCAGCTSASVRGRLPIHAENLSVKHSLTRMAIRAALHQRGVTLIELMVTVVVMGVILAIGIPSFRSTIASSRLTGTTNDLVGSLALARSEAIRRGTRVSVCMSGNSTQCAGSGGWNQGWIVFADTTRSGTSANVDSSAETILSTNAQAGANVTVTGGAGITSFVSFSPDGQVKSMTGAPLSGTLRVCSVTSALSDASRARDVQISASGRITTLTPSVADTCPAPTTP